MYNRYWNTLPETSGAVHKEESCPPPKAEKKKVFCESGGSIFSNLGETFSGRLQNLHFDLDTLIIIIAIYFLIADCEDFDTDLLILIGVLFLLGF